MRNMETLTYEDRQRKIDALFEERRETVSRGEILGILGIDEVRLGEVEGHMRPCMRKFSDIGFIGKEESLIDLIQRDLGLLIKIGIKPEMIKKRLDLFVDDDALRLRGGLPDPVDLGTHVLSGTVHLGSIMCPFSRWENSAFEDGKVCGTSRSVLDLTEKSTDRSVLVFGMTAHGVGDHIFFEGRDTPARVDPLELILVLGIQSPYFSKEELETMLYDQVRRDIEGNEVNPFVHVLRTLSWFGDRDGYTDLAKLAMDRLPGFEKEIWGRMYQDLNMDYCIKSVDRIVRRAGGNMAELGKHFAEMSERINLSDSSKEVVSRMIRDCVTGDNKYPIMEGYYLPDWAGYRIGMDDVNMKVEPFGAYRCMELVMSEGITPGTASGHLRKVIDLIKEVDWGNDSHDIASMMGLLTSFVCKVVDDPTNFHAFHEVIQADYAMSLENKLRKHCVPTEAMVEYFKFKREYHALNLNLELVKKYTTHVETFEYQLEAERREVL